MAAHKGNQYAKGNNGGRPAYYTDPADLHLKCGEYFAECEENKERPTIAGLILHLGFCDKKTLYNYKSRPGFDYPVGRALLQIEADLERRLTGPNVAGVIFALKNMGWTDKVQTEITGKDSRDLFKSMTDDELNELLTGLQSSL